MLFGLPRKAATEFSFFLAIPTLIIASIYQLYKERELLAFNDIGLWVVGFVSAFVSASHLRALAATLHFDSRFHHLCLVSDCLWRPYWRPGN